MVMLSSSLDHNPPNADRHITPRGSDWLWAVMAIMGLSTLGMVFWQFTRPRGTRFFHNIALIILTTSTICYFVMASDLGATPTRAQFSRGTTGTRQIFFVRYIQWFINFPLILLLLLFATGLSLSDILTTAFFAWVVVVCGLAGALTASSYKWGFFAFGLLALFYIWSTLLGHGPRTTFNAGQGVRSGYVRGSILVALVTALYPIAWGCSEGGNVISPTAEAIWYGILDLILGPIFLYYFLFGLRKVDHSAFGINSGKWSDGAHGGSGSTHGHHNHTGTNMAGTGTTTGTAAPVGARV
ncbi:hypothetical protein QCA50_003179 [Cerrena zonata]|uniref:Heat shock protein 30 n=1 Tax=Cerrena zonata TaxID=2478898 RepID=A0AAW0GVT7_9APHY